METLLDQMTFQKYGAYKDSGEYWLGEIPEHWELYKLKHLFYEKKKVLNPNLNSGSISFGKVVYKDDEKITEATKATYQEVLKGEFLINPLNLNYDLISLRIALSEIDVVVSSGYIVIKNNRELNKRYFNYLLHRYDVAYMKLLGSGVRQTISFTHIANSQLAFPPLQEQTAIAAFLDDKTAKIDRAIAQKEKMIGLLKERKQILIQELVTGKKVWNPAQNAFTAPEKVKDSGVAWIGEVPEHWAISKLKYLTRQIVDGTHFTPTYVEQGVPFLRVTDISNEFNNEIDWLSTKYIPFSEHKELIKRAKPEMGDVLLSKNGTIGITRVVDWDVEFSFFVSLCLIKLTQALNPYFFCQFFDSPIVDQQITFGSSKTSVTNLHLEKIKELLIVLPPVEEQLKLVAELEKINSRYKKITLAQLSQIEKLKELKASLIDGAVTGKIKVS